jgi:hypothetical protein
MSRPPLRYLARVREGNSHLPPLSPQDSRDLRAMHGGGGGGGGSSRRRDRNGQAVYHGDGDEGHGRALSGAALTGIPSLTGLP